MNFKNKENSLMWESFNSPNEFEEIENYNDDDQDVKNVVMSFDTSEPVESEIEHDESENDHDESENNHERNEMIKSEIKKLSEFARRLEEMSKDSNFEPLPKMIPSGDECAILFFKF